MGALLRVPVPPRDGRPQMKFFTIKIQVGDTIMFLSSLYAQVRLLSFFRKCLPGVQVK